MPSAAGGLSWFGTPCWSGRPATAATDAAIAAALASEATAASEAATTMNGSGVAGWPPIGSLLVPPEVWNMF